MKKLLLFCFILCSSYAYSQNSKVVLGMLKNAKDSIAANRFESASRILDGAAVYGVYLDSISYWRNVMKRRGIEQSYEKYKERSFDMAMKYYQDVMGKDSNEVVNYYWMSIAPKMCLTKRIIASVILAQKGQLLGQFIRQHVKRKISKDEYVTILEAILKVEEMKGNNVDVSFLHAFQDETTQKWGFKDSHGIVLIPYDYDAIVSEFKAGLAIVKKDGIFGFLHLSGMSTFNMNDSSAWNTLGNDEHIKEHVAPTAKLGDKTIKEYFEEIQKEVTY